MKVEGSVFYVAGCENRDGIGRALVNDLLKQKAKVCAVDLRTSLLIEDIAANYGKDVFTTYEADLTAWKELRRSFDHAIATFGKLDAVILNAGIYEPKSFWEDEEEDSFATMNVNFGIACKGTRIAIDQFLKQQNPGLVIVTGSVAAQTISIKTPVYCASKWAVEGFVRSLGFLHKEAGIRVVVLEPGVIKTAFWHQIGIDPESIADQPWTPIPDIVKAWNEIISDEDGIPGGSAFEVTALGRRLYPLEGPRTASSNKTRTAGGDDIVHKLRSKLGIA